MTVLDAFDRAVCDDAELAERLDRPHAAVSAAVEAHASRVPRSLDSTTDDAEREPATIGDVIGLDDAEYERAEARTTIERLTSILDPRARDVLRMRFQHDLRQWEIAAAIGCSQMQVPGSSGRRSSGCPPTPPWPAADGR
jgi:RNA polymerase sigma-B factor